MRAHKAFFYIFQFGYSEGYCFTCHGLFLGVYCSRPSEERSIRDLNIVFICLSPRFSLKSQVASFYFNLTWSRDRRTTMLEYGFWCRIVVRGRSRRVRTGGRVVGKSPQGVPKVQLQTTNRGQNKRYEDKITNWFTYFLRVFSARFFEILALTRFFVGLSTPLFFGWILHLLVHPSIHTSHLLKKAESSISASDLHVGRHQWMPSVIVVVI